MSPAGYNVSVLEFGYTSYAQEIVFGPGSLDRLGDVVGRFGWRRLVLCSSPSARRLGFIARIEDGLGNRLAAVYDRAQPHVPEAQVAEALALAVECAADAVVGLGGGSSIGLAKAVSAALEERYTKRPARAAYPTDQPLVPVLAIPNTYAGSEMTAVYGVTRSEADGTSRKVTTSDPKIAPKLVLYDPELTLDLPPDVTAASGINALAHCIEAMYSIRRSPLSSAAALAGVRPIVRALPRCRVAAEGQPPGAEQALEARTEMMLGAHLAGVALASVVMGLHHGLCHVLGGSAGVPHGIANAIVLPHAMRFNLDATAPELAEAAAAMGMALEGRSAESAGLAAIQRVTDLVAELKLPQRLREAGVQEADLPRLAQLALRSSAVQSNPKPIREPGKIEELLREMW